jgi:hypothetical protein
MRYDERMEQGPVISSNISVVEPTEVSAAEPAQAKRRTTINVNVDVKVHWCLYPISTMFVAWLAYLAS